MHINTLKSIIKQDEGDYTVLRLMFTTPGAITGKKEDTVRSSFALLVSPCRACSDEARALLCSLSRTLVQPSFEALLIVVLMDSASPRSTRRSRILRRLLQRGRTRRRKWPTWSSKIDLSSSRVRFSSLLDLRYGFGADFEAFLSLNQENVLSSLLMFKFDLPSMERSNLGTSRFTRMVFVTNLP